LHFSSVRSKLNSSQQTSVSVGFSLTSHRINFHPAEKLTWQAERSIDSGEMEWLLTTKLALSGCLLYSALAPLQRTDLRQIIQIIL
jgi:hypothetical protein